MSSLKIIDTLRHYVGDAEALSQLGVITGRIKRAKDIQGKDGAIS